MENFAVWGLERGRKVKKPAQAFTYYISPHLIYFIFMLQFYMYFKNEILK